MNAMSCVVVDISIMQVAIACDPLACDYSSIPTTGDAGYIT